MDERSPRRPRARSEATRRLAETTEAPASPTQSIPTTAPGRWDGISPTTAASAVDDAGPARTSTGIRRRSTAASRRSGVPSLTSRTTLAQRTQGNFTLAGPEETPQMRLAHEPFVHPGYAELNPSYEQPANAKPVWSLAKPLPRVVRPGMVPTKEELLQARANAQLPAENSQKLGLDVDPNDLELGQIEPRADPRKIAAQVEDARVQRENNFLNRILTGEGAPTRRLSRASSVRPRRSSVLEAPEPGEVPVETPVTPGKQSVPEVSDEPLQPVLEHPDEHKIETQQQDSQHPAEEEEEEEEEEEDHGITEFPPLDSAAYPEDLHPLVQELVEDEIHNNHTTWSVIRTHHREALAEALAVFVQLTVGISVDLSVTLADAGNPNTTGWCWGFAAMMGIYISGGVSGAHMNPTITLMLWFYRGFPKRKIPSYFAAQFLGAFVAALAVYGLYHRSIAVYLASHADINVINSFVTSQRMSWIDPATAFFNEFLGTLCLTVTVLALGDDQNAPPGAGMNSLIIGFVVACLSMTFSYQTGAAFNPSRDFGPRLALLAVGYGSELFTNPYWFYGPWAGSLTGAFVGAFLYDAMIFTGGESPVNYPWERTQRAMRKSRKKWKRRLRFAKRKKMAQ
ncbi:putative MIP transporter [Aspergillus clavatus NRRL 1]|uniref:MIP transporter, putative n=1 Tax=Aspergillus clavatus (strain ATCC 1007 / CBS 513.65 / DSM 816 / NCTC 3887 / NRRL 1 / QM 1276 / 107) TaxID=344612 RepID=A1CCE6_ASPCL|nr:MIP transporter, putative [Aspergillus clavatus NRRL 1]EAW12203.1 MIP transporter, putative [Aspergillus clavatus NRRL 1]